MFQEPKAKKTSTNANISLKSKIDKIKIFIILDEASCLLEHSKSKLENSEEYLSKYRILIRSARELFQICNILFLVTSTNSNIGDFVSNELTMSSSEKKFNKSHDFRPFYEVLCIDYLVPGNYQSDLKNSLFQTLDNRDPFNNLLYFGRPLWGSLIDSIKKSKKEEELKSLMVFAEHKILFNESWEKIDQKDKLFSALALISVRTTFNFSFKGPEAVKLIEKHMCTLYKISDDKMDCEYRYISEPILSSGNT